MQGWKKATRLQNQGGDKFTHSIFLTAIINAQEGRNVATAIDIPETFMHLDMDKPVYMRLDKPMAKLLTQVNSDK